MCKGLSGQAVHQIEVEILEQSTRDLDRSARVTVVVYASERL